MHVTRSEEHFVFTYSDHPIESAILWERHCHARFELIAVLEGTVALMTEGTRRHLAAGDVIVIPPLLYHTVAADQKCNYRRATLLFDLTAVPAVLQERLLSKTNTVQALGAAAAASLDRVAPQAEDRFYLPLLDSLFVQILYEYAESTSKDALVTEESFLKKTLAYIEKHLCEPISLDEIALHATCSKSSLCHLFREKMNITVKQYILQKRIALAIKRMDEGMPPTVAAASVGYENYSNFYRIYRKLLGHSPREK